MTAMNDPSSSRSMRGRVSATELSRATRADCRWGANAALCSLLGIVISGPLAVLVLSIVRPQPQWSGPEHFVRHYHWLQSMPYFGGFLLVFGFVAMMASLYELAPRAAKARAKTGLVFAAAFAALASFNYVTQTTFVANVARHASPQSGDAIATFSMANPSSLAWALEMWAYGLLGVASWLMAVVFTSAPLEKVAARLFEINGVSSIGAAMWASADPSWMMTSTGLVAYAAWNLLVLTMLATVYFVLRRRVSIGGEAESVDAESPAHNEIIPEPDHAAEALAHTSYASPQRP